MHKRRVLVGAVGACLWLTSGAALAGEKESRRESVIEGRFAQHESLKGRGLDADVEGSSVTLTGTVRSEGDKLLAGKLAQVKGVATVDNQLTVEDPTAATSAGQAAEAANANEPRPGEPRALSDPYRKDPLVGAQPQEATPDRATRFRTMGMKDPKAEREQQKREQAQANELKRASQSGQPTNTMSPTVAPATGSDHPQTGNQSSPPAETDRR